VFATRYKWESTPQAVGFTQTIVPDISAATIQPIRPWVGLGVTQQVTPDVTAAAVKPYIVTRIFRVLNLYGSLIKEWALKGFRSQDPQLKGEQ
jgi:hypothetical protein